MYVGTFQSNIGDGDVDGICSGINSMALVDEKPIKSEKIEKSGIPLESNAIKQENSVGQDEGASNNTIVTADAVSVGVVDTLMDIKREKCDNNQNDGPSSGSNIDLIKVENI